MTDISLHRRLMRKRVEMSLNQFWLYQAIKKTMDKAKKDPEFGKLKIERVIISDNNVGVATTIEPSSKWQRFVEAWARFSN